MPVQAAFTSYAGAFIPRASATAQATDGVYVSPRMVAQMTQSMSLGFTEQFSKAFFVASIARKEAVSVVDTWREPMPVRVRIHSSDVSIIFARSSFVTDFSASLLPVARILKDIMNLLTVKVFPSALFGSARLRATTSKAPYNQSFAGGILLLPNEAKTLL